MEDSVVEETRVLFTEAAEVERLVLSLAHATPPAAVEAAASIARTLDKYQEAPTVLDSSLEPIVSPLLSTVRSIARGEGERGLLAPACAVMYTLCKVRGYKTIVKFVPHEARDLEPLVALLAQVPPDAHEEWQVAYSLMVWLSMVVMVPFDLSIIDSSSAHHPAGTSSAVPLVKRIEQLACAHLSSPGPARDAAAVLCARLLTRPGLQTMLREYIAWGTRALDEARSAEGGSAFGTVSFTMVGIYSSLAAIFKLGHREELLPQLAHMGPLISAPSALLGDASVTRRKLGIKLLQRVALVFLPPRLASWRYQRGARSLLHNLEEAAGDLAGSDAASRVAARADDDDDALVPEAVEGILEQLLSGLRDADTVVRWSAAKGVGRITSRLPLELADDVVGTTLELLASDEDANAWHGGCLALAELARRGLLLPERLPEVLPRVVGALHYDVPRGTTSVGTHVRDAACYVCWAFARAFDASVMAPHVATLAQSLLVQVAFDREVNVRRAASAAFQENVGRQGNFPHGIDIVTVADYFSVGSRNNSYLKVAAYLARFDEYRIYLLEHLLHVKSRHWDESLRLLAARAAAELAPLALGWSCSVMLPELCKRAISLDLRERHGSVHMAAEVLLAICTRVHGGEGSGLPPELRKTIAAVAPAIEKARLYRGRGGEVMRGAVCRLLEVSALVRMPCGPKTALRNLTSVDESLKHPTEAISLAAVAAIRAITSSYFSVGPAADGGAPDGTTPNAPDGGAPNGGAPDGGAPPTELPLLVPRYAGPLSKDPNAALRRGYALAIGALPAAQLNMSVELAVDALVRASEPEPIAELRDPETRRNAIGAMVEVAQTLGLRAYAVEGAMGGLPTRLYVRLVEAVLAAFADYQMDNRGDVGSWVREAAMAAAMPLLRLALPPTRDTTASSSLAPPLHTADEWLELRAALPRLCQRMACELCQQVTEKIDRVRELAAITLAALLREPLPHVHAHTELRNLFVPSDCPGCVAPADAADFLVPSACFPITVHLLSLPAYRRVALRGLSVSAGGITESTLRGARGALNQHLAHASRLEIELVGEDLISLILEHSKEARLALPLLRMTEQLLEARVLETLLHRYTREQVDSAKGCSAPFAQRLHEAMRTAVPSSAKDMSALMAALTMEVLLLPYAQGRFLADLFRAVLLTLGHRYPKLRKAAADQLYIHLLTYGDPAAMSADDGEGGGEGERLAPDGPERLDECLRLLTETAWLADLDEQARPARARMFELFKLRPPQVAAANPIARPSVSKEDDDSYAALVGEMGY